jgi:hypothetical protein
MAALHSGTSYTVERLDRHREASGMLIHQGTGRLLAGDACRNRLLAGVACRNREASSGCCM